MGTGVIVYVQRLVMYFNTNFIYIYIDFQPLRWQFAIHILDVFHCHQSGTITLITCKKLDKSDNADNPDNPHMCYTGTLPQAFQNNVPAQRLLDKFHLTVQLGRF